MKRVLMIKKKGAFITPLKIASFTMSFQPTKYNLLLHQKGAYSKSNIHLKIPQMIHYK